MDDAAQARAYAEADFAAPHERFVDLLAEAFPAFGGGRRVLDLGCGPADIAIRFARRHPGCEVDGVDAAAAMLALGEEAVARAGLGERIRLLRGYLPGADLPGAPYDGIMSNSLLHHLADPTVLWAAVRHYGRPGAPVFVMDLARPASPAEAEALAARYAADEPAILRRDFHLSLLAAYRPDEVRAQLAASGLPHFSVRTVGDRHLTVQGRLPE
jgi:SAM-dependent methyltransferase